MLRAEKAELMVEVEHFVKGQIAKLKKIEDASADVSDDRFSGTGERFGYLEEKVDYLAKELSDVKGVLNRVDEALGGSNSELIIETPSKELKETAIKG